MKLFRISSFFRLLAGGLLLLPVAFAEEAADGLFDGEKVLFLANRRNRQMLSSLIVTRSGELIVIDGGYREDAEYLLQKIREYGNSVSAWFLTHPHVDHVSAFNGVVAERPEDVVIETVYRKFPPAEMVAEQEPASLKLLRETEQALTASGARIVELERGESIEIDGVSIKVLRVYEPEFAGLNASSSVLSVEIAGKRLLYLGDLSILAGEKLLRDYGAELKSDIVQMAHHGSYGVSKQVYGAIRPQIAVWPTPPWLWENNRDDKGPGSGPWQTDQVRKWLEEIGGVRNLVVIRDILLK